MTTPYLKDHVTYYIVSLTDQENGISSVEIMFYEYNLYLIAFETKTCNDDPKSSAGWFAFNDVYMLGLYRVSSVEV